jgi:ubiquinone/menaquinone biosynthesis C-methylase UbiE
VRAFRTRVIEPEILDKLPPEAARASLADLVRLNRGFGGHSAARHAIAPFVGRDESFSVLDVGAASGDMGDAIRAGYPGSQITSLDYVYSHLERAPFPKVAGNAFRLPFRDSAFDVAFSSLFLHHFPNEQIVEILMEMRRVSRRGVAIVDLHRHPLAYYFVPATRWLFGWDPVTVHDAKASVAAAFIPEDLASLAIQAGLSNPTARSHGLSFRLTLSASR